MRITEKKIITSVVWRFFEKSSSLIVNFFISIVLARLLGPEEFGTVALLAIFLTISSCIIESGFSSALIQKKDADDLDFNSVFYFTIFSSLCIYVILYLLAPYIASYYSRPILVPIVRVLSIKLIFDSISNIHNTILMKKLLFSKSFFIALPSSIVAGFVGIVFAYNGYGVWALVFSGIIGSFVMMILRFFLVPWMPKSIFSFNRLKKMLSFSYKVFTYSLIDTFFSQIYGLLIGKKFSATDLGFYNRGNNIPQISMSAIQNSISSVLFPTLSDTQDDILKLKSVVRKSIQGGSLFIFPLMFLLATISESLIVILYSEKWMLAIPFMQISCIAYSFFHLQTTNHQAILALKRSDIFFLQGVLNKIFIVVSIIIMIPYGVIGLALSKVILIPISFLINAHPNVKLIGYSFKEQLLDFMPSLICSFISLSLSYPLKFWVDNCFIRLTLQTIIFILVYVTIGLVCKIPLLDQVFSKIRMVLSR